MKKTSIILFICGFVALLAGLGIIFVGNIKEDRKLTLARMEDVKNEYKNFSNSVDVFNDIRNSLYLNVFDTIYLDTMADDDESVKKTFSEYEKSVNDVKKSVEKLSNLCGTIYFPDGNVNSKCSSYGTVYEQIVNAFVSDVSIYNGNIEQYNQYQEENSTDNILLKYETKKKYIDYNNDNKYEGKEE